MEMRHVFIISDRTGITAETLSHSLLTQFPGVHFHTVALPFVDSVEKVDEAMQRIDAVSRETGNKPLVFTTFVEDIHRERLQRAEGIFFDFFDTFLGPLERELNTESSHSAGQTHGMVDVARYTSRISAVNFSVHCDDGIHTSSYDRAMVVLMGVSRSGKTPTCLYLALHFGIYAANYPLTEDDFSQQVFPDPLRTHRDKLFGLTIDPERLQQIRQERLGNGHYSELRQCRYEVTQAEALYRQQGISYLDATSMSIEEIGTTVIHRMKLHRDPY